MERRFRLVPTTCFNCEANCGLLAWVDKSTGQVAKFEGNPVHPASRGRNCAKGPATLNQVEDPERILYPLKRVGDRGEGLWEQIGWDQVLDEIGDRIGTALREGRGQEVMYHVGRPGDDSYMERVLHAWGIDGHNSHTNICSSGARVGYATWMGFDRPSADFANAKVIFLISSHLEAGHYFNPHAQRILDGQRNGATVICVDPRLSNTASQADHWLAPWPGTEAFMLLAIARWLLETDAWDREFVRRWVNWETFLKETRPDLEPTFDNVRPALLDHYEDYTMTEAARVCGLQEETIRDVATAISNGLGGFASHTWRASSAGNLGGWQVARCLQFLVVLTGSVGTEGGTSANGWNKFIPVTPLHPEPQGRWNELTWPIEYPLSHHEMSILLPHFLKSGRGRIDTYFTRVYNPIWTNPDGFTWLEVLRNQDLVGCHVALTPTWNESAWFADYVLPMGVSSERHDLASYETHSGRWVGFRQPVLRRHGELEGRRFERTHEANPGEVWEEEEFWIDLSWRIDPDGSLGVREKFESQERPGTPLSIDEYYSMLFEQSVPGLPEAAEIDQVSPLEYMRRKGAFALPGDQYRPYETVVPEEQLAGAECGEDGVFRLPGTAGMHEDLAEITGHMPFIGDGSPAVQVDGRARLGFPTPSKKLELYSETTRDWGWPEYALPTFIRSQVHWEDLDFAAGERVLVPTFRIPTLIHTRSANSKWLNEISHRHPLWIHPTDADVLGIDKSGLVRITTRIGWFVISAWRTEGIRPGVVAASHHMGRWRLDEETGRSWGAGRASIERSADGLWRLRREDPQAPYESDDADTGLIWWSDTGVHQNLAFPVQPDPVSGMHCWLQRVTVAPAADSDAYGDVVVDTNAAHTVFEEWLAEARPGPGPDGLRRPLWFARPVKPLATAYRHGS
ncbi:MAG: molybdopterin-dependent oxidoreductase [Actinomycetota bacterium]|nr:molybdopterin-dependent oxidoreductase [Actinomycetota bacterium]